MTTSKFLVSIAAVALLSVPAISAAAAQQKVDVEAGPIWNQADAESKCPQVASDNGGTWTGSWHTTIPGRMSVCQIRIHKPGARVSDVEAGPIWSQSDAESKCPAVATAVGGTWNGKWRTTVPGQMSVCEVRFGGSGGGTVKNVNAGPIWSNADAQSKCPQVAKNNGGTWTGNWHTTVPGQMSVCEVRIGW